MFAWAGAALFLVSLVFFFYTYLVTFAEPAAATPASAVAINAGLFTLFALHHSVFARERVRARVARVVPPRLERSFYVWVASLLFIAVCALWQRVGGVVWRVDGAAVVLLWTLQLFGAWLTFRSAAIIDIRELAGLRQATKDEADRTPASGGADGMRPVSEFKTVGPYGWVRHPIYSGWLLLVFASSPMTGTRFSFAVISSAYLLLAIPLEERSLRATTGGAYEVYMRQVRWKLVPGVY